MVDLIDELVGSRGGGAVIIKAATTLAAKLISRRIRGRLVISAPRLLPKIDWNPRPGNPVLAKFP